MVKTTMDVLGRRTQPRVYLNKIQIARAVALIEEGHSRRRVAQMMNVSHSAISRAWIRHLAYGIVQRCPYPQRQRSTTPREDRLLTRWALQERRISARALQIDSWQVLEPEFLTKLFEIGCTQLSSVQGNKQQYLV
jgi:transposase